MAATYEGKIMARSPYYITATGAAYITSAELRIYIWSGLLASKPATATYTMNKNAKTATETNIVFEIAHVVRDYFAHGNNTTYVDCLHVEIELDVIQTTSPNPATVNYRYFAFDGYGEFSDGVNYEGSHAEVTRYLLRKVDDGYTPLFLNSDGVNKVETYSGGVLDTTWDFTTEEASTDSTDKVRYHFISNPEDELRLYNGVTLLQTIYIDYIEECKHTPRYIKYYDKNGLRQIITMFKKSTESVEVSHDYYNSMIGEVVSNAYTYDVKEHERRTLNTTGKVKETISTGFVDESMNEVYKQLLASEFVWVDDVPCIVTTKNIAYKTQLNDKLIEYTFEFEHANNFINEV